MTLPCDLLAQARALHEETQLSLAAKLREQFPRHFGGKKVPRQMISNWERDRDWRPRRDTWIRLRAVLPKLPALGRGD
jgi:hypothetical protein